MPHDARGAVTLDEQLREIVGQQMEVGLRVDEAHDFASKRVHRPPCRARNGANVRSGFEYDRVHDCLASYKRVVTRRSSYPEIARRSAPTA